MTARRVGASHLSLAAAQGQFMFREGLLRFLVCAIRFRERTSLSRDSTLAFNFPMTSSRRTGAAASHVFNSSAKAITGLLPLRLTR